MPPDAEPKTESSILDAIERSTYRLHIRAAVFEGLFTSVMWGAADVAARNMDAGPLEVTLITMAPGAALLVALFFGGVMDSASRRQLFIWPAFLGRLPILFVHNEKFLLGFHKLYNILLFVKAKKLGIC